MKTSNIKNTIVFIHGNSSSAEVFKPAVESDLLPYNKLAIDLLGHGNNQPVNLKHEKDFSITAYKNDILKQLESINDGILLVGNSLGGHIAIEIASSIKNLKGLVIFGAPPLKKPLNFEEAYLPVEALQTFFKEHPQEKEIELSIKAIIKTKSAKNQLITDFKKSNPLVRKAIATDAAESNFADEYDFFTNSKTSKYIIVGDHDVSVNTKYLHKVADACNGTCKIIPFKNCGHYPSIEQPQEFNTTLSKIAYEVFSEN